MNKNTDGSSDPTKTDSSISTDTLKPETKTLWLHPDEHNRSGCVFTDSPTRKLNNRQDILELLELAGYDACWNPDDKNYEVNGVEPDFDRTICVLKEVPLSLENICPTPYRSHMVIFNCNLEIWRAYKTAMKETWKPVVEKLNAVALRFWMTKQVENGKVNHKKYEFKIGNPQ